MDDRKKEVKKNPRMIAQVFQQLLYYLDYAHNLRFHMELTSSRNRKQTENLKIDLMSADFSQSVQNIKNFCQTIIHKDLKPANILIRSMTPQKI